jgi:hypothetical protein
MSAFSGENFGFVQWTRAFLGVSSYRGTNIENCALLQKGHCLREKGHFRPEGGAHPLDPLDPPMDWCVLIAHVITYHWPYLGMQGHREGLFNDYYVTPSPWSISTKLSDYYFFMPIYGFDKFRRKISKNKICHFWQTPLASTGPLWNIFFITEWIALKLRILTDIKIRFKKKQTFSQSAQEFLLQVPKRVRRN